MSDTYKWGTAYPIKSFPGAGRIASIYVPSRRMWFQARRLGDDTRLPSHENVEYWTEEISGEPATHWMPLPPSPEEMAAKPNLEEILRKEMREAEEDKLPQVKNYLIQILKEAGLE